MKRLVLVLALVLLAGVLFAQDFDGYDSALGLGIIGYAWNVETEGGMPTRLQAVNWGIGYTDLRYFSPAEVGQFNWYWAWGTVGVIIPYIAVGGDYYINEQVVLGGGLLYINPYLNFIYYL